MNTLGGVTDPEPTCDMNEVGLRIAAKASTYEVADQVRHLATPLWISGPIGTAFGTPLSPRKTIGLWPTLVPREFVVPHLNIREVRQYG